MTVEVGLDCHDGIPVSDAVKIHPDICWSLLEEDSNYKTVHQRLMIWHWCTHSKWHEKAAKVNYEGWSKEHMEPHWHMGGVLGHTLTSLEPLHLEPSLIWPDCCGMHGFIRQGKWVSV